MPLFQKSVLNKFLKEQDKTVVEKAYEVYYNYFHNPEIQHNIYASKEEQFQEGFLRELFVNVFGFVLNPNPDFNLTTEFKNEKGSKKADGAILKDGKAIAVIELKSTKTKDLESIRQQAFDYKANQSECVYVITSNFQKLRFYVNNAVEFEEFDLFALSKERFEVLHLCLNSQNLLSDLALKIKNASLLEEENITKKFYADYSLFKKELFEDIAKRNTEMKGVSKLQLYKKTQKLLDRFLFIFFAEDRGLLPPNSISRMIKRWNVLNDEDAYKPLYEIYKQYFGYLNTGRAGKVSADEIHAYNGGLFLTDEILDEIEIDDAILLKHTSTLTNYDFDSQVDVNILGHIFEHSLNEIETTTAELEGVDFDKQKSKRKKDGVFYTPKYITKYIVDNTVGKLCEEKKTELSIKDDEFAPNRKKETKKKLLESLEAYRKWLLELTICDPACGSGAFLNQALECLINEHHYIDGLNAQLFGSTMVFQDVENQILENNIFGVDINEESVDIARLSLWLRTAQRGRKLTTLNKNIKCGNSLIDDPDVAGDKAFNWEKEFPEVFKEKEKTAWHITTATHNSRYSQRMFDNHVKLGESVWVDEENETLIAKTIADIVKEDNLNVIEYNICGDHMHMLLVCEKEELTKIVGKIKGISGRKYNIANGITVVESESESDTTRGHVPLSSSGEEKSPPEESSTTGNDTAIVQGDISPWPKEKKKYNSLWTQKFGKRKINGENDLQNVINYIHNNRQKHQLPQNKKLEKIINEMCCSTDHAFRDEYKGGFDVVIGNPPYVHLERIKDISNELDKIGYKTFDKRGDIYSIFVEKGFDILKRNGLISYIMPNKWLQAGYGKPLREFFLSKNLKQLIDFGDIQIFKGATTYPCIFIAQNDNPTSNFYVSVLKSNSSFDFESIVSNSAEIFRTSEFSGDTWVISSKKEKDLLENISNKHKTLSEFISDKFYYGLKTGLSEAFLIDEMTKNQIIHTDQKASNFIHPFLQGRDVQPYLTPNAYNYLLLFEKGFTKGQLGNCTEGQGWVWLEKTYPSIAKWLSPFEEKAKKRTDKGDFWWEIRACDYYSEFHKPKIMYQAFQVKPCFVYDVNGLYCNNSMWLIPTNNKSLVAVLNSKMGWWLITKYCTQIQNGCQLIWKYFGQIPIPELSNPNLLSSTEQMLDLQGKQQSVISKFVKYLQSYSSIEKIPKKLQNWHKLNFGEFIKELNKAIKKSGGEKLSKMDEMEWMEVFETKKAEAQTLKAEIDKTDNEIDRMVYELYGLSEEEIGIVEGS